ncbi:MAG TPA: hypothetical protein VG713_00595 [Pirellulales bacterium]|nr:hypothetical protein [Pirellulales bacterium]
MVVRAVVSDPHEVLEQLQDELLEQLDELNFRVEQVLAEHLKQHGPSRVAG